MPFTIVRNDIKVMLWPTLNPCTIIILRALLKAIGTLQNAHLDTEKLFMDSKDPIELANDGNKQQNEEQQ